MSQLERSIASRLYLVVSLLRNLNVNILVSILVTFLSRLDSGRDGDFLQSLADAVVFRTQSDSWPSVDDDFQINCTQHRISPSGVKFGLSRQMRSGNYYWYLYKSLPNGKQFYRYVGVVVRDDKLQDLYDEYDFKCKQILSSPVTN